MVSKQLSVSSLRRLLCEGLYGLVGLAGYDCCSSIAGLMSWLKTWRAHHREKQIFTPLGEWRVDHLRITLLSPFTFDPDVADLFLSSCRCLLSFIPLTDALFIIRIRGRRLGGVACLRIPAMIPHQRNMFVSFKTTFLSSISWLLCSSALAVSKVSAIL